MTAPDAARIRETLALTAEAAANGDADRFHKLLWHRSEDFRNYLLGFRLKNAPDGFTEAYVGDAFVRFLRTLELVPLPPPHRILEIGSNPYFFHTLLVRLFPSSTITGSNFFDHNVFSLRLGKTNQTFENEAFGERYEFPSVLFNLETVREYPFAPESFDLVFFCETLEHLIVDPLAVFSRLRRLLAPGGKIVITLPNAVRLSNVALMLAGCNFFDLYQTGNGIHGRHNREFTLEEVSALLGHEGFVVESAQTQDRYDYDTISIETADYTGTRVALPWKKSDLVQALERAGARLDNRGDNIYVRARNPLPGETIDESAGHVAPRIPARAPTLRERILGNVPRSAAPAPVPLPAPSEIPAHRLVDFFIDRFEEGSDTLEIAGWGFLVAERDSAEGRPLKILLESDNETRFWPARPLRRLDVAASKELRRNDVGFEVKIPFADLAPADYRISLWVPGLSGPAIRVPTGYALSRRAG